MNDCVKLSGKSKEWTTVWNCPASLKNERLCETVRQIWRTNDCVKLSGKQPSTKTDYEHNRENGSINKNRNKNQNKRNDANQDR